MTGEDATRARVALAVVVEAGRVLLARRVVAEGSLSWVFPGGAVEPGESAERASVREAAEEVGVVVEPVRILGERVHPGTGRHLVYVACRFISGQTRAASAREVAEVEWAGRAALQALVPQGFYTPVQDYLDGSLM
ncbi:NUDIX domain-containing protein [Streptomyces sp. NBC_00285]|uniref:NUDIX hydrolase n=1 Tax=Streptomyces sp. NBC_00285 TaxID=2975700 RepID=UPI002E2BFA70|nr:NUDIX domain-containing protein [Streptomyces sp. NBC_00285]